MRTKKIALNMISDILPYIFIGIIGLIKVNVLIKYIGDVGNGYYQFITQIIAYVFLAQAGFSDAVIYRLYKPFAKNDKDDINAVYSGTRKIFRIIGFIILGIILLVSLGLYLFYGFEDGYKNTALFCFVIISCSYLISYFGKMQTYGAILSAAQEKYVYSLIFNSVKLLCDISIVLVVIKFQSLEAIAITILIAKIVEEIIIRYVVKRKYSWLHEIAKKDTSMVKMVKDLAWVQVGYLVLNNTDAVLLMFFLGPVMVSIYTTYNFILRYLNEISSRVELSAVYSFGNVFAKKEDDKVYSMFREFFMLFIILAFSISLTFMLGIRSFVFVWIGESSYLLSYLTVVLFTSTLFLNIIYYPLLALINANGLFKENKRHIFICSLINIVLSVSLIVFYGIDGILFGTAVSLLVNIILKSNLVTKRILFKDKHLALLNKYFFILIIFIGVSILFKDVELLILSKDSGFLICLINLILIFVMNFIVSSGLLCLFNQDTRNLFKRVYNLIKRKVKK